MNKSEIQKLPDGNLYVGWSEKSITPDKPVKLAGQFFERISESIQSSIVVTVLAIETRDEAGNTIEQMMIGSCDLLYITRDIMEDVRQRLEKKLKGFDTGKLFLCATHTHTAPLTDEKNIVGIQIYKYIPDNMKPANAFEPTEIMYPSEYREFLVKQLCKAFMEAWENRSTGSLSWQLSHAVVGHNRRVVYNDGHACMYGSTDTVNFEALEGPADHGVELLYLWNETGDPTGVVVNIACPSQVVEMESFISSDYWGEVRKQLKAKYGKNFNILPLIGAAGDQSPRDLIRRGKGEADMSDVQGLMELGKRVANSVIEKYESALEHRLNHLIFLHEAVDLDLPVRTVGNTEYESAKAEFNAFISSRNPDEKLDVEDISDKLFMCGGIMNRYEEQCEKLFYSPEIHIIRLGDIAIASNPFELFTGYGLRIKAASKAQQTFIVQLACDSAYYLPTQKAVEGGDYSAIISSGIVGPEGGKILVNQTIQKINEMW